MTTCYSHFTQKWMIFGLIPREIADRVRVCATKKYKKKKRGSGARNAKMSAVKISQPKKKMKNMKM